MNVATSLLAFGLAVLSGTTAAEAEDLRYTLTGPAGGYAASWVLPAMPLPDSINPGQGFALERVTGAFPQSTSDAAYIDFFSTAQGGGITIADADTPAIFVTLNGAQLYRGAEAMPTMLAGVFALRAPTGAAYSLAVSAVPEPATWMLALTGFGLVGTALRRSRRVTVRYA